MKYANISLRLRHISLRHFDSLRTIGNESQTFMLKISDNIEQFLEHRTASFSFPTIDENIRYLVAIMTVLL